MKASKKDSIIISVLPRVAITYFNYFFLRQSRILLYQQMLKTTFPGNVGNKKCKQRLFPKLQAHKNTPYMLLHSIFGPDITIYSLC